MNMRFKVGEIAVVAFSTSGHEGKDCEIVEVGAFPKGMTTIFGRLLFDSNYAARVSGEVFLNPYADWMLRKKHLPPEPASLTRTFEEGVEV